MASACKKALTIQNVCTSNSVRSFFTYAGKSYHPPGTTLGAGTPASSPVKIRLPLWYLLTFSAIWQPLANSLNL